MTDLVSLAGRRQNLEARFRVLAAIRGFFQTAGFLEVQTPIITSAPAPEVHIDAVPAGCGSFLTTSPELYMKRLLADGYEKIFQITPVFRQGERGRLHHPEFTMLEWYRSGSDYRDLEADCRMLLEAACRAAGRTNGWDYRGTRLRVEGEWQRYTVRQAFLRFAGWEPNADVDQNRFDEDLVGKVEPHLGFPAPCIIADYPASQAALARLKPSDPSVAERFELYWAGIELANGFSELTDAMEQRSRFMEALRMRESSGRTVYPLPEAFLGSLERLPACSGIALGLDRLVMLLCGAASLDEVVAFPPEGP